MSKCCTILALFFAACSVTPVPASAQVLYGSLTGNVTDKSGGAVANAKVEALDVSTNVARQAATDERGSFLVQDIQAGTYKVTISAPGFANTVANWRP